MKLSREADELARLSGNPATAHKAFKQMVAGSPPAIVGFATKICAAAAAREAAFDWDRGIIVQGSISIDIFIEVFKVMSETVAGLAAHVFCELPDADRAELARIVVDKLKKPASIEQVGSMGRTMISVLVEQLVTDELTALRPILEHRVKEVVKERFDKEVDAIARARLEAALAKVRKELAP